MENEDKLRLVYYILDHCELVIVIDGIVFTWDMSAIGCSVASASVHLWASISHFHVVYSRPTVCENALSEILEKKRNNKYVNISVNISLSYVS